MQSGGIQLVSMALSIRYRESECESIFDEVSEVVENKQLSTMRSRDNSVNVTESGPSARNFETASEPPLAPLSSRRTHAFIDYKSASLP